MKFYKHIDYEQFYLDESGFVNDELQEIEADKEELIVEFSGDPDIHAGKWEHYVCQERHEHGLFTLFPWPAGKYKITIEPLEDELE